jgi:ParB family chromosome partitioning protein
MEETKSKIKTREGSGYLKQLYSTARTTASSTHSHLKNLTTFLVNFLPVENVDPSEQQVRTHFDPEELKALAHSIKEHGVLQPILVVQDGDRYKVIAGERRLRASKMAGVERIPARVLTTTDQVTQEIALRENLDRMDLHPLEEGEGYITLLEFKAYTSHDAIAQAFGKPKSRITECIGFTRLPDATKEELLKRGIRNRGLMRKLLQLDPSQHISVIESFSEDTVTVLAASSEETTTAPKAPKPKKPALDFTYLMTEDRLAVPGFKWKKGEGKEKLEAYCDSIKKLLGDIEKELGR